MSRAARKDTYLNNIEFQDYVTMYMCMIVKNQGRFTDCHPNGPFEIMKEPYDDMDYVLKKDDELRWLSLICEMHGMNLHIFQADAYDQSKWSGNMISFGDHKSVQKNIIIISLQRLRNDHFIAYTGSCDDNVSDIKIIKKDDTLDLGATIKGRDGKITKNCCFYLCLAYNVVMINQANKNEPPLSEYHEQKDGGLSMTLQISYDDKKAKVAKELDDYLLNIISQIKNKKELIQRTVKQFSSDNVDYMYFLNNFNKAFENDKMKDAFKRLIKKKKDDNFWNVSPKAPDDMMIILSFSEKFNLEFT